MTDDVLAGRRIVHLTTTDISLGLLLGRQLQAFGAAGMEVIGASAPGPWSGDLAAWGVRHEPVRHATRSMSVRDDALALPELVRLFRRLRPDIVHTHNPKPGVYGRAAARLAGVPVVVNTVHGLYATRDDPFARRALVYGVERTMSLCSQAELVQNPEDVATLERIGVPRRKLVLLGNGIDLGRFRARPADAAKARVAMGLPETGTVVGVVGRLVWEKGFAELFDAAARLRRTRPDLWIAVIGPVDHAKESALRQKDLDDAQARGNIVFLGERRDVEDLYPGFDLFVLPSHREGFPRAAMEAAACGIPVVATDIRGCRQVVDHGHTGLLVPARDGAALAGAIEELAADPGRRRDMSAAARARAETEFDDQRVVRTTLDTYRRLLSRADGSTSRRGPRARRAERVLAGAAQSAGTGTRTTDPGYAEAPVPGTRTADATGPTRSSSTESGRDGRVVDAEADDRLRRANR
ncbi:MAG TPA: glycosyltransferase family 4 protein [Acidimicrobiales bacterium]|nr:glycosyltransferase family 4 protein [Acidimicrobiales bacterium]